MGLGTVGTGVVRLLEQQRHLTLKKVAVKELQKERTIRPACPVTTDVSEVIDDPEIEILIEVMGGEQPALDYIKRAIDKRKHIVTANKEVLAKHGPELFQLAKQKGVAIFFEASVAGGVPLISTISKGLEANKFSCVTGILNGTTNFILSKMEEDKESYAAALEKAQSLDSQKQIRQMTSTDTMSPTKLSILSALSYQRFANPTEIIAKEFAVFRLKIWRRLQNSGIA